MDVLLRRGKSTIMNGVLEVNNSSKLNKEDDIDNLDIIPKIRSQLKKLVFVQSTICVNNWIKNYCV